MSIKITEIKCESSRCGVNEANAKTLNLTSFVVMY